MHRKILFGILESLWNNFSANILKTEQMFTSLAWFEHSPI